MTEWSRTGISTEWWGHERTSHRVGLHGSHGMGLVVFLGRPSLFTSMVAKLATATDTTWLTVEHKKQRRQTHITTPITQLENSPFSHFEI